MALISVQFGMLMILFHKLHLQVSNNNKYSVHNLGLNRMFSLGYVDTLKAYTEECNIDR